MSYKVIAKAVHIRGVRYERGTILPEELTEVVKDLPSVESVIDGKLPGKQTRKSPRKGVQREITDGDAE